jgi:CRISPR-associated protein Csb1
VKESLEPAAGPESVFFPPTFAPPEDKKDATPSYVIDRNGVRSVCLVDSVGSQANRLEPIFMRPPLSELVPQVTITVKEREVNLLEVGHRAADALVRSTALAKPIEAAFTACAAGDMVPIAKIAPTSIVFGAWDSRGTNAKLPRLVESTIRAFDVMEINRAAQYFSALENEELDELLEAEDRKDRKLLSKAGYLDSPSGTTHGGIIARGGILRTTILNLVSVRAVGADDAEQGIRLRRYILGLAMVATLAPANMSLRTGCLLVRAAGTEPESTIVTRDGQRTQIELDFEQASAYASAAAQEFGVGESRKVTFDSKIAKQVLAKAKKEKKQ